MTDKNETLVAWVKGLIESTADLNLSTDDTVDLLKQLPTEYSKQVNAPKDDLVIALVDRQQELIIEDPIKHRAAISELSRKIHEAGKHLER